MTEEPFCTNLLIKESDKIETRTVRLALLLIISIVVIVGGIAVAVILENENSETDNSSVLSVSEDTGEEKQKPPGFEGVFAISGLLAVAYLVLRQRQ